MYFPCLFQVFSKIYGKGWTRISDDKGEKTSYKLFSAKRGILNHLLKLNLSRDNIPTEADLLRLRGSFFKRD